MYQHGAASDVRQGREVKISPLQTPYCQSAGRVALARGTSAANGSRISPNGVHPFLHGDDFPSFVISRSDDTYRDSVAQSGSRHFATRLLARGYPPVRYSIRRRALHSIDTTGPNCPARRTARRTAGLLAKMWPMTCALADQNGRAPRRPQNGLHRYRLARLACFLRQGTPLVRHRQK